MTTPDLSANELAFQAKIVSLILSKEAEEALEMLSVHYNIEKPKLVVGMPKRCSRKLACYVATEGTIHVSRREFLNDPHVILHEFYHHLRNLANKQKGIEKYADRFAENYLRSYSIACLQVIHRFEYKESDR